MQECSGRVEGLSNQSIEVSGIGLQHILPTVVGHFAGYGDGAAGGARLEGQGLVESRPSVLIGFVIGINRN